MRHVRGVACVVLALGAAALPARLGGSGEDVAARLLGGGASRLRFEPSSADFGSVFAGETARVAFRFTNPSDRPVRIVDAASTCACVQVSPAALWIDAGGEGELRAAFVTDGRYGPQTLRIRVRTDEGPRAGRYLTLRGSVRAVLRPRPARLLLGAVRPGSLVDETVALDVLEPVTGLAADPRGVEATLAEGAVRIRATVPFAVGTRFHGVLLRFRHVETGRELETWIPVVWSVPSPLVVEPKELDLSRGEAALVVRPRWPGVAAFAGLRAEGLPLEVRRRDEGGAARFTLIRRGAAWEFPASPKLLLDVDPPSLGPVEVPVYLYGE